MCVFASIDNLAILLDQGGGILAKLLVVVPTHTTRNHENDGCGGEQINSVNYSIQSETVKQSKHPA